MTQTPQPSEAVRRMLTATARLIAGCDGDPEGAAFSAELMLIVGGELDPVALMWLASTARANRSHVLHLAFSPADPVLPRVTFAHREGELVTVYESCILWSADDREPARILRIDHGVAFQMGKRHRLRRRPAPVADYAASIDGVQRALDRLYRIADALDAEGLCMPIGVPMRGSTHR